VTKSGIAVAHQDGGRAGVSEQRAALQDRAPLYRSRDERADSPRHGLRVQSEREGADAVIDGVVKSFGFSGVLLDDKGRARILKLQSPPR